MDILLVLFVILIIALSIGVILYQALQKNPKPLEQTVIELSCEDTGTPRQISSLPTFPFQIVPSTEGWGSVYMIFYGNADYTGEIASQLVMLDGVKPATVYPVKGTKSIGYYFVCNPFQILVRRGDNEPLNPNIPYSFLNPENLTFTIYYNDGTNQTYNGSVIPNKPNILDLVRYTTSV